MRVLGATAVEFRRFTDLRIEGIPADTRLVVIAGPNGSGKSSLFDVFRTHQSRWSGASLDETYQRKAGAVLPFAPWDQINVTTDIAISGADVARRAFYCRSAYRSEPDFNVPGISGMPRLLDAPRPFRMIDQEASVSGDYQYLLAQTLASVFDPGNAQKTAGYLSDALLGVVREAMGRVFEDLVLEGLQDPFAGGTLFFTKGGSRGWPYKNLSGGEKAAFDLLLDLIVKREVYNDTVYCIDEPETHLNTRVQAALLRELLRQLPSNCQLWIASHSIGMMREALALYRENGGVVFLDFGSADFDKPVVLRPVQPTRDFWAGVLGVALGDLAELVAPREVVIVEGRPKGTGKNGGNVEFDAICLRRIFRVSRPETEFISMGASNDVANDRLAFGGGIQTLVPGVAVVRLIDRDERTDEEVETLVSAQVGCRVLSRRDLENFLLSDEAIGLLCDSVDKADSTVHLIEEKNRLLSERVATGGLPDDVKAIAGQFYVLAKSHLGLPRPGSTKEAFLRDVMAPLIRVGSATYHSLQEDIFGVD